MTKRKIFAIIGICVVMLSVFATSAFCNDLDAESQATTIAYTGASGIESIEFRLADGPNGGVGTTLLLDYPSYLRDSNTNGIFWVDIPVDRNDDVEEFYRFDSTTNRVYGYAGNSVYIATYFNILHIVDGAVQTDVPVKELRIHYKNYCIHNYSTNFQRPYDGNIDSTIGVMNNVAWTSRISYRTSAVHMADYRQDGRQYYSVNNMVTSSQSYQVTTTNADGGAYIPVGVRYNYSGVLKPTYKIYNDGVATNQVVPSRYNFSLVTNAEQTVLFDTPYSGRFTITDMYSVNNNIDITYRLTTGSPPSMDGFEVGTFLRNSVDNFMDFEIAEGFTLKALLWLIVGIGAVFALLYIFIGK